MLNQGFSPSKFSSKQMNANSPGGSNSPVRNPASLKFFSEVIFPAVYRLLDEYMAGRGKNLPPDLKQGIDRLVKAVYD
jgi:hypothetical protein